MLTFGPLKFELGCFVDFALFFYFGDFLQDGGSGCNRMLVLLVSDSEREGCRMAEACEAAAATEDRRDDDALVYPCRS